MVGLALAAFLEYRDASFRSQDDVTTVLSLPVLAQIPLIATPPSCGGSAANG